MMEGFVLSLLLAVTPVLAPVDAGTVKPLEPVVPLRIERTATPLQAPLGTPFVYELVLQHLPTQRYELRAPKDLGPFELLEVQRSRLDGKDRATTRFRLKMSLFELGKHTLPTLTFDVTDADGVRPYVTEGIEVEAVSALPPDAQQKGAELMDIKGPEEVPIRSYRLLWGALGLIAAAVGGVFLYRYLKRPRPLKAELLPPPLPLATRTRNALEALREENLPAHARGREFYFRLSDIVRAYLGERYGLEALECTSSELLEKIRRLSVPALPREELHAFILQADFVKFAKFPVTEVDCANALEFGFTLVQKTTPSPLADARQPLSP